MNNKKNNTVFLTFLLALSCGFPPLATDMYMPSFPQLIEHFQIAESTVNLTLVLFFITFSVSTLIWGPVSDKYGRKPATITGVIIFTLGSLACAFSQNFVQLLIARMVQAIGTGAPLAISFAIVQDVFTGETKKRVLSILSGLAMIAPVIGPLLGSTILEFFNWQAIFITLGIIGVLTIIGFTIMNETSTQKKEVTVVHTFVSIFTTLKNSFFTRALIVFSLPAFVFLGFVGGSPLLFMSDFGVSSRAFSLFFGANAIFATAGSLLYPSVSKVIKTKQLAQIAFAVMIICGVLIATVGAENPMIFLFCIIPVTLTSTLIRPLGVHIMMDSCDKGKEGAASSLINFFYTVLGSIAMQVIAFSWGGKRVVAFGTICVIIGVMTSLLWPFVYRILKEHNA